MASTERLYLQDTYSHACSARVVEVRDGAVVLDRTVFHPQGGGQPTDRGTLKLHNEVAFVVANVKADGDVILHFGQHGEGDKKLQTGDEVEASIDLQRRLQLARLHSAGHALDAAVRNAGFAALTPTKGYHFEDGPYVEYEGALSVDDRATLVDKLNAELALLIEAAIETAVSQSEAGLRVVSVGGCACPCGGTHVRSTAELRGLRVTKAKAKSGRLRVSYTIA
eukprot:TRINITY_DN9626_c0_g1_i1.p1 TRINITY_DN9626_c0_g1~~TRINITY_DN9626_c0_g1_i1.p1  ORF type:complete len:224 (-),score=37.50 TRINITY_DN9626_c0_g1_i1:472-1143(-)